jgi:N6-adenosine-specific RNA methylase IME4/ParB-like chromosome segregation protein Spo0J
MAAGGKGWEQSVTTRSITEINIGKRHRVDYGDVDALARSIDSVGLLHPVVIRPDGRLIAGARRIKAFKQLGREKIPVTVVDLDKIVLGEHAENTERKDFTITEAVAILRELRPIEEKAAKERQAEGRREGGKKAGRGRKASGQVAHKQKSRAADKAAKATGRKRRTLEKAEKVIEAAEREPERYGDLVKLLEEDDVKVDAVRRTLQQRQERANFEARKERGGDLGDLIAMAQAGRRFKVIYGDPAWKFKVYSGKGKQRSADRYYDTESLDGIKALPIAPLADDDCALFLWGVWPELPGALEVIKAWGFEYKTVGFLWIKTTEKAEVVTLDGSGLHWGMGYWTRANTEFCLLATKGSPLRLTEDVHQVVVAPVSAHSVKPEAVAQRIESLLVGPYLELFGRRPRSRWTVWSNEHFSDSLFEAAE